VPDLNYNYWTNLIVLLGTVAYRNALFMRTQFTSSRNTSSVTTHDMIIVDAEMIKIDV